jgi:hypothetical protein
LSVEDVTERSSLTFHFGLEDDGKLLTEQLAKIEFNPLLLTHDFNHRIYDFWQIFEARLHGG